MATGSKVKLELNCVTLCHPANTVWRTLRAGWELFVKAQFMVPLFPIMLSITMETRQAERVGVLVNCG